MPTILLVRHAETDWNRSGQIMGDQPIPLNERGRQQARTLAQQLEGAPVAAIVTSPVLRAAQTAEALAGVLRCSLSHAAGLREIGVGDWVNRYWNDLSDEPARRDFYTKPREARPPGGETLWEVQQRAVAVVEQARATHTRSSYARHGRGPEPTPLPYPHTEGHLLFVTHADVIRTILSHYLDIEMVQLRQMRIDHASITAVSLFEERAELLFLNHTLRPLALL
jgi:broad specificity phosphatase PhoE